MQLETLGHDRVTPERADAVDSYLKPVQLQGSWLGTLSAPEHEAAVSGAAEGHAPPPR